MVVPNEKAQRPAWSRASSWTRYIRKSDRKLQEDESERSRRALQVHFNDDLITVHVFEEFDEPSSEDCEDSVRWYAAKDYEKFDKDRKLTALQYKTLTKRGTPFIEREHSVRGLESLVEDVEPTHQGGVAKHLLYHHKGTKTASEEARNHTRVVLEEQRRQRAAGCYPNPFIFREVSSRSSKEARKRSAALGEADALAGYVSSSRALHRRSMGVVHSISRKMLG